MKNKIYKILTVVVMLSLILSLVCVNASAFEREDSYVDIEGDDDYQGVTSAPGSIYGDDYALIMCGDICDTYGWGGYPSDSFKDIFPLNRFLGDVARDKFVSPLGMYTSSDYETLKYLEFFVYDIWNGRLYSKGIYPVGIESDLILGNGEVFVREVLPGEEYSWWFATPVADSCYFSVEHHALVVACYFDDFNPYDTIDVPDLVYSKWDLEQRVDYLNDLSDTQSDIIVELNDKIVELNEKLLIYSSNADIDDLFTGVSDGLLTFITGIGALGFTSPNGVSITISSLITLTVLGAVLLFILRMIFGGGKS